MAFIINYNPQLHDLYLYASGPTIDPENYANNQGVYPIAYNPNLWVKLNEYGFSAADFSGLGLRIRGAPPYGFDEFAGQPGVQPSGVRINENGTRSYPYIINSQFFSAPESDSSISCYSPGCPPGNFDKAKNFQYWNNGQWCKVLISPKHFISCAHYVGGGIFAGSEHYFLGKNNQIYGRTATKIIDTSAAFGYPILYPPGFSYSNLINGIDIAVFELAEPFTEAELEHIKIYKILNSASMENLNVPTFVIHPQGTVSARRAFYGTVYYNFEQHGQTVAFMGYIDNNGVPIPNIQGASTVWVGDSGTPELVYVPSINETCLLSLRHLVSQWSIYYNKPNSPNIKSKAWCESLQKYISDTIGYTIGFVDYSAVPPYVPPPPEPYPLQLNIDGNTYILLTTVPALTGSSNSGFKTIDKSRENWYGVNIDFAILSYNVNGFSGYSEKKNIYMDFIEVEPPPDLE